MGARLPDRQNQALAVLAIATAAIGFGLFGADWELQFTGELNTEIGAIYYGMQLAAILGSIGYYFAVLWDVARILRREDAVSGLELVRGPVLSMAAEMLCLAWLFLIRVFL